MARNVGRVCEFRLAGSGDLVAQAVVEGVAGHDGQRTARRTAAGVA